MRLGTDGAKAIEDGGDIAKSAVVAPGKLAKAPSARASSNSAKTTKKRLNPTLQRDSPSVKKHFLNFEGWGRGMIFLFGDLPRARSLQHSSSTS